MSSKSLRFLRAGEYALVFPSECPVRLLFCEFDCVHSVTPNYHDFYELIYVDSGTRLTVNAS
jgi:hypothetical protein